MNIIFDEMPGEIFDFFRSLWYMNNYEFVKKSKEEYGIVESNEFEKAIEGMIIDSEIDKKSIERYFYLEMKPEFFTGMKDVWKYPTIESYIEYSKNLDEYELIMRADQAIQLICKNIYEDTTDENELYEDIEVIKERILNMITDKDIPIGLKWEYSLFLRNPKEYMKEVTDMIYRYIPLYKKIHPIREETLLDYNQEFRKNLDIHGLNYLLKEIGHTYDFSKFEEIKITTTALVSLQVYSEDKTCYVLIGPSIKKAMSHSQGEGDIEKNLNLISGISEPTRYRILQLLYKREYYGQEIADVLNITKTTTFYHLNFLLSLKVVKLEKDGQKNYYSLDREFLFKNIDFFKNNIVNQ